MINGKDKFSIENNITVGIDNNNMHYAIIKDDNGITESVILRKTSSEIWKELIERGEI